MTARGVCFVKKQLPKTPHQRQWSTGARLLMASQAGDRILFLLEAVGSSWMSWPYEPRNPTKKNIPLSVLRDEARSSLRKQKEYQRIKKGRPWRAAGAADINQTETVLKSERVANGRRYNDRNL